MAQRYNKNGIPVDERRQAPKHVEMDFEKALLVKLDNMIDVSLRLASALEHLIMLYEAPGITAKQGVEIGKIMVDGIQAGLRDGMQETASPSKAGRESYQVLVDSFQRGVNGGERYDK